MLALSLNHDVKIDSNGIPIGEPTEVAIINYAINKIGNE